MLKGTKLKYVSHQFNEIENIETKVLKKWKEYIVVARNTGNTYAPILLQFYENRDIPRVQEDITKPVSKWDTVLSKNTYMSNSTLPSTRLLFFGVDLKQAPFCIFFNPGHTNFHCGGFRYFYVPWVPKNLQI